MLNMIKIVHTIIWIVMTMSVFYIGYSVFVMNFDVLFYISLSLIAVEIIVILVNSWRCPLTSIARRYTDENTPNFDIYLPEIIAQYNKEIFSIILFLILLLYIFNTAR